MGLVQGKKKKKKKDQKKIRFQAKYPGLGQGNTPPFQITRHKLKGKRTHLRKARKW